MQTNIPLISRSIFTIALALAPLLFGSVYPWAYGLMEIAVLLSFGLLLWQNPRFTFLGNNFGDWGAVCLAGLIFMAGLQLIPLPGPLVRFLAEPIYNLWKLDFLPPHMLHSRSLIPLTVYPYATASVGILFWFIRILGTWMSCNEVDNQVFLFDVSYFHRGGAPSCPQVSCIMASGCEATST